MNFRILIAACACLTVNLLRAEAAPPLLATRVEVFDTEAVQASVLGSVRTTIQPVPGNAALGEDGSGKPKIAFLGCRFDVELAPSEDILSRAVQPIGRKLATDRLAPSAGFGWLKNPQAIGITDPVTAVECDPTNTYVVFLFRHDPSYGDLAIEALIFEYDDSDRAVFEKETFNPEVDVPSNQVAGVVSVAKGLFRINFRTPEDIAKANAEQAEFARGLMFIAPKLLGVPFP
jgi:hypothetical protein